MKKRLKGLLALTLALCMVLTMGVGLVSAEGTMHPVAKGTNYVSIGEGAEIGIVEAGKILYANYSANTMALYYDDELVEETNYEHGTDVYKDGDGSNDLSKYTLVADLHFFGTYLDSLEAYGPVVQKNTKDGYMSRVWAYKVVSPVEDGMNGETYYWFEKLTGDDNYQRHDFDGYRNVYLTSVPIAYNIKYVNEDDAELNTPDAHFAIAPTDKFDDKSGGNSGEKIPETPKAAGNIASEEDLKKNGDETAIKVGQIKDKQVLVWETVKNGETYVIIPGESIEGIYPQLAQCGVVLKDMNAEGFNSLLSSDKVYEKDSHGNPTTAVAWVKQNITLTAKWKYGIKYEGAGGADKYGKTMSQVPFDLKDIPTSFAANMFTYEGKTFAGWNTQADGKGQSFAAGEAIPQVLKDQIGENGSITLYAVWEAPSGGDGVAPEAEKPYTLKYKPNKSKTGLKGSIPSQKFYESADNTTSVDENMYIKPIDSFDNADQPGYSFTWNTKANGKGKMIEEWVDIEDVEDTLIKAADKNNVVTLYAQRTMNTYKINYFDGNPDDPDTEPIDEQKITAEDVDEERLPDADDDRIKERKPGYILKGWKYVDKETGEEIIFEPGQKIDKDMFADIAAFEGMELYAVWEKIDDASGTGDISNILPWLILATAAALGAVVMATRKRTEK